MSLHLFHEWLAGAQEFLETLEFRGNKRDLRLITKSSKEKFTLEIQPPFLIG